ncbi:Cnl2/NKP2 family protein-domain-containing protein [Aspergillus coremiiformis]|uniref:Cnl2/NKP2 family protein-domain-containing protein n=1 Tax=Aspergillus coremiiformis TaxID=138285 RepID=A0A5N6Z8I7_9EURO|nr:Cnl2/NKP2 family protein-domain-containing protein [Aspergillus coremiiformis]
MPPSETSILSNFLLSPASLPTVISLQQFTELFPKRLRSHPHIRVLYRELQQLREQDMDLVNGNIDQELRQGETQKSELRKSILTVGVDGMSVDDQREMDLDVQLFGQPSTASPSDYHSVSSLLSAMEGACANIEREISGVDKDATTLLSELNQTVGEMSDLRYGKMQGPVGTTGEDMVNETIRGLEHLEDACYRESSS